MPKTVLRYDLCVLYGFSENLEGTFRREMDLEGNRLGGKEFWREFGFKGKALVRQNVL